MILNAISKVIQIDAVLVQHFRVDCVVMVVLVMLRVYSEFMVHLSVVLVIYNVFLDDIKAHFEDIVLIIVVTETFFLVFCVNVAQLLGSS